jgi:hypothetical protein
MGCCLSSHGSTAGLLPKVLRHQAESFDNPVTMGGAVPASSTSLHPATGPGATQLEQRATQAGARKAEHGPPRLDGQVCPPVCMSHRLMQCVLCMVFLVQ